VVSRRWRGRAQSGDEGEGRGGGVRWRVDLKNDGCILKVEGIPCQGRKEGSRGSGPLDGVFLNLRQRWSLHLV
jgi:hypothetical protein